MDHSTHPALLARPLRCERTENLLIPLLISTAAETKPFILIQRECQTIGTGTGHWLVHRSSRVCVCLASRTRSCYFSTCATCIPCAAHPFDIFILIRAGLAERKVKRCVEWWQNRPMFCLFMFAFQMGIPGNCWKLQILFQYWITCASSRSFFFHTMLWFSVFDAIESMFSISSFIIRMKCIVYEMLWWANSASILGGRIKTLQLPSESIERIGNLRKNGKQRRVRQPRPQGTAIEMLKTFENFGGKQLSCSPWKITSATFQSESTRKMWTQTRTKMDRNSKNKQNDEG